MPTESEMDAFRRGEQAYARGAEMQDNPYGDGTGDLSFMWECGWVSANCKRYVSLERKADRCGGQRLTKTQMTRPAAFGPASC